MDDSNMIESFPIRDHEAIYLAIKEWDAKKEKTI